MTHDSAPRSIVIVGAGITGLTAAHRILTLTSSPNYVGPEVQITVIESDKEVGGKIKSSSFAGFAAIDEGPDAYLTRVPHAVALSRELNLGDDMVNPVSGHAAVMHKKLHPIPAGLMLGVPTGVMSLATSSLLTWRGKIRAGLEPILPSSGDHKDSIGNLIRQRFGKEVQQLLVDPLVGSIYAADTNNFSLAMVPQLDAISGGRSVLLTARKQMAAAPKVSGAIFETPRTSLTALTNALRASIVNLGGTISSTTTVQSIEPQNQAYLVTTDRSTISAQVVIVTSPARSSASLFTSLDSDVSRALATTDHASVVMVTLKTQETNIAALEGLSGYLVPKPDQDRVTAVSFGSTKWTHWKPADGSMILRVSLGRDGAPTNDLIHEWEDQRIVDQVIREVSRHTKTTLTPETYRVTRWAQAFPQYRPQHLHKVESIETSLTKNAPGIYLAGASMRGIGIPACVAQAENTAVRAVEFLQYLRD